MEDTRDTMNNVSSGTAEKSSITLLKTSFVTAVWLKDRAGGLSIGVLGRVGVLLGSWVEACDIR